MHLIRHMWSSTYNQLLNCCCCCCYVHSPRRFHACLLVKSQQLVMIQETINTPLTTYGNCNLIS